MMYYMLIINIIAFIVTIVQNKKEDIEDTKFLLFPAFFGGAIGAVAASALFRFKRGRLLYKIIVPTVFIAECFIYCFIYRYFH